MLPVGRGGGNNGEPTGFGMGIGGPLSSEIKPHPGDFGDQIKVNVNVVWSAQSNYTPEQRAEFLKNWLGSVQKILEKKSGIRLTATPEEGRTGQAHAVESDSRVIETESMQENAVNIYATEATLNARKPVGGATEYNQKSVFVRYNVAGQNWKDLVHEMVHALGISGDAPNGYTKGPSGTAEAMAQRVTHHITAPPSIFKYRTYDASLIRSQLRRGAIRIGAGD